MFREGNDINYVSDGYGGRHDITYVRNPKDEGSKDANEIKEEIWNIKKEIIRVSSQLSSNLKYGSKYLVGNKILKDKLDCLYQDMYFWKREMDNFDNLASHKVLKHHVRKVKDEALYNEVKSLIQKYKKENAKFVTIEDMAMALNVDKKQLPKIFMKLNREGILSQPSHQFMHDSNRGCYLKDGYYFRRNNSDWYPNIYYIQYTQNDKDYFDICNAIDTIEGNRFDFWAICAGVELLGVPKYTLTNEEVATFIGESEDNWPCNDWETFKEAATSKDDANLEKLSKIITRYCIKYPNSNKTKLLLKDLKEVKKTYSGKLSF